ncbi:3-methyl-2-oxobutanoate hydroxymethyltransferase [Vibrio chagasii]|nr:3-methyl-2-oxobutanoate hydroxymethyltransferase [Vibrio chagasii]
MVYTLNMPTYWWFKVQGKTQHQRDHLIETARNFKRWSIFIVTCSGVDELTAREITRSVSIPTIGIGASPECDGQVLVTEDMLGLFTEYTPKFIKKYIDLSQLIKTSF